MRSLGPSRKAKAVRGFPFFLLVTLAIFSVPVLSAQSTPFNGPRDYVVGSSPQPVVGDFNGDGRPDVATANYYSNNISVLLQNSDGTFQPAVNYPVGNGPQSLQIGDVNGDGKLDLLTINSRDNTLSVLLGNGDGAFQAQKVTTLPGTPQFNLAVGDFNGDGKADVAITEQLPQVGTWGVLVMLGNGDATFQPAVSYQVSGEPLALAAADFNNDGKLDVASANRPGVSVLLGNGDGTFQAAINTATAYIVEDLVVADFNQDGNLDLATTTSTEPGNTLTLLLGNGNGSFQVVVTSQEAFPLAAGDLNGDGKPDLIAAPSNSAPTEVLLNNGDGTFTVGQSLITATSYVACALSDLNGQGKLDLVAAVSGTNPGISTFPDIVSVLNGNGDGTFANFPSYVVSPPPQTGYGIALGTLAAADFKADGKIDLAAGVSILLRGAGYPSAFGLFLNDGAGFVPPAVTDIPQVFAPETYVAAGDFNGDGRVDLAVASQDIAIFLGNGDGTFQTEADYGSGMVGPIALGDFNNDGKLDVIGVDFLTTNVSVLLGNGDGTFGYSVNSSASGGVHALAVGDFNHDGKLDAAVLSGSLVILFGNGDGTFSIGQTYDVGFNPTSIASGDLNGDGIPDLVVGNSDGYDAVHGVSTPSTVVVLLGNGDGTFQSPVTTLVGNGISSIAIADFNLDGKADVMIGNTGWSDVSLLLGNGDGTFQAPMLFYLGTGFPTSLSTSLAVADFDGNGTPDVAVANGPSISILLNEGSGGPAALLSPGALAFANEMVGQTSTAQTASLSYMATTALTIASIAIVGPQSGDYQQTNNCGTKLGAGTTCTITVTFTPQAAGVRTAAIRITDNAINSPQGLGLIGTASSLGLTVPSGGTSSATVAAGQPATYTLAIGGGGVSGMASLTCTGAPTGASCNPPGTVNVSGASATTFTVSVTTTSRTLAASRPDFSSGWWAVVMLGMVLLPGAGRRGRNVVRRWPLALLLLMCSCGGGSSGGPQPNPNGTPAGSYTLMLSASSGSTNQSMPLTLNVQ